MKTLNELRAERAALVKKSREFLETRAKDDMRLSAEDDATYSRMEDDLSSLDKNIERMERLAKRESDLEMPVNTPLTAKPGDKKPDMKKGIASDMYKNAFWNNFRQKRLNKNFSTLLRKASFLKADTLSRMSLRELLFRL